MRSSMELLAFRRSCTRVSVCVIIYKTMSENDTKMLQVSADEFQMTCRACLDYKGITNVFLTIHADILLCELYSTISLLELKEGDGLPKMLCSRCTDFIFQFYAFRKRAQESETVLKNTYLNNLNPIKEETSKNDSRPDSADDDINESCEISHDETNLDTEKSPKRMIQRKVPKDLTCTFCNLKFDTYGAYKVHRKKEANRRRKKTHCTICHKLISSHKLREHVNSHTKERPYECQTCGEKFRYSSNLTRHKFLHKEKKPHECHICGRGFIQISTLTDHIRMHYGKKSFMCNVCGKGFVTKGALGHHITMHKMKNREEIIVSSDLVCNECNKAFSSKASLRQHLLIHYEKKFLCSECGKKFSNKYLLCSHMRIHSGVKPYCCEICNKSFSQKSSLNTHILVHTGEKPILCITCGKRFSQKGHLTSHMRLHSRERPYSCSYCDKTFSHSGTLKVHIRIHTGEKPFVCHVCSKGFYDSSSMKKHIIKVHDEVRKDDKIEIMNRMPPQPLSSC